MKDCLQTNIFGPPNKYFPTNTYLPLVSVYSNGQHAKFGMLYKTIIPNNMLGLIFI